MYSLIGREELEELVLVSLPQKIIETCGKLMMSNTLMATNLVMWKGLEMYLFRWLQLVDLLDEKCSYVERILKMMNPKGIDREAFFDDVFSEGQKLPPILRTLDYYSKVHSFDFAKQQNVLNKIILAYSPIV